MRLTTTPDTTNSGSIWYNTSINRLQYSYMGTGTWSAGGALITTRWGPAGAGTQNAGLAFGGVFPYTGITCTEEYTSGIQTCTL